MDDGMDVIPRSTSAWFNNYLVFENATSLTTLEKRGHYGYEYAVLK